MWSYVNWCQMMWNDLTWCDMMWNDVAWCEMMWNDLTWCDMMWNDVTWCEIMWNDVRWCSMVWNDVQWCEIEMMWHDVNDVKCWFKLQNGTKWLFKGFKQEPMRIHVISGILRANHSAQVGHRIAMGSAKRDPRLPSVSCCWCNETNGKLMEMVLSWITVEELIQRLPAAFKATPCLSIFHGWSRLSGVEMDIRYVKEKSLGGEVVTKADKKGKEKAAVQSYLASRARGLWAVVTCLSGWWVHGLYHFTRHKHP